MTSANLDFVGQFERDSYHQKFEKNLGCTGFKTVMRENMWFGNQRKERKKNMMAILSLVKSI